jgi:hypothetical protein
MAKEKIYVGKGLKFGEYDQVSFSVEMEKIKPFIKESKSNGLHYINLVIVKMKEKDKNGKTHTVYVDQWEKTSPEARKASNDSTKELNEMYGGPATEEIAVVEDSEKEDLNIPF